jgi:peptide/nickel transport system substrate-binding protein
MKRRVRLFAGLVSFGMLAAACGGAGGGTSQSPGAKVQEGGVLRVGSTNGIDSLNPFVAFNADAYTTFEYTYPYLVQFDAKLNVIGDFATKWETSSDGKTWTFHTVPGATWSDGQALTAADAAWTYTTMLKYKAGPASAFAGILAHLSTAVAPDPNTLTLTYSAPVANVLPQLQQAPILPEHVWSKLAAGDGKALRTYPNAAPYVSGGPFVIQSFTKGQSAVFARNPRFYGPKPHVDGWGFQFFSNDDAMITALKSNQIDAVESVPPTNVSILRTAGFTVATTPAIEFHDFIFNSNPNKPNNRELLDPTVRLALDHAVDRQKIVQVSYLGYASPGSSIIAPSSGSWYDPKLKPTTFDLNLANQMLDQLGYAKGPDGIRVANGHPMSYTVIFPSSQSGAGDRTFQIIQADWQQIGVKITQRTLDPTAAFNAILAPDNKYLTFDMSMWDWFPYLDPDFMLSVLTCGQYGSWSDTAYCNKAYDQLYNQQGITIDPKQRQQIVWQMQDMIYNARPYLVLDYPDIIEAYSKQWTGFVSSLGSGSFTSTSKLSFEQVHKTG